MKKLLGIAALAALSGCAPRPVATVYCVSPDQLEKLKAAEPPKVGQTLTGQAQDDLKIIAGNTLLLRSWGEGLLGVLGGCTGN